MTEPVADAALDDRVRTFLRTNFPDATVRSLTPMAGGHSGNTLLAELDGGRVDRVVVKAGALGRPAVGRHDVLRQARLFDVLADADGVRVPRVLASDAGDPHQFAMTFAAGDCTEPVLDGIGDLAPLTIETRARAAARMLAALHQVEVDQERLGGVEPLRIEDEIARWAKVLSVVDQTLVRGWHDLVAKLERSIPASVGQSIVHGDYRLGNMLCDGDEPTAVIDWEIWSITDPRVDLGWTLLFCDEAEYPGVGVPAPGMPTASQLLKEYEGVAGPTPDVEWFLAFGRMKTAAIMSHNLKRHREGRYDDPFQERLPPTIASMVDRGLNDWSVR